MLFILLTLYDPDSELSFLVYFCDINTCFLFDNGSKPDINYHLSISQNVQTLIITQLKRSVVKSVTINNCSKLLKWQPPDPQLEYLKLTLSPNKLHYKLHFQPNCTSPLCWGSIPLDSLDSLAVGRSNLMFSVKVFFFSADYSCTRCAL